MFDCCTSGMYKDQVECLNMSGDPCITMVRIECDTDLNAKKIIEMHNDIIKAFVGSRVCGIRQHSITLFTG